jgi:hypothetical protein
MADSTSTDTSPGYIPPDLSQLGLLGTAVTAQSRPCGAATGDYAIPQSVSLDFGRAICSLILQLTGWQWLATVCGAWCAVLLEGVNWVAAHLVVIAAPFVTALATEALAVLDAMRKDLDPTLQNVAVTVLNELLGTDFNTGHLASGTDVGTHLARAGIVGGMFHDQLAREFISSGATTLTPSPNAARAMSGLVINFGTATGLLAVLGGFFPEIHLDEVREIGEQVAKNLGLGRLNRQAMMPLVRTLIATPYQWFLNQKYHPTQFKLGDVVNPFTSTLMSSTQIFNALDLEGYSADKIDSLIKLHEKKLTIKDAETLKRWQLWTSDQAHQFALSLGWPEAQAETALSMPEVDRLDHRMEGLISALEKATLDGLLGSADLVGLLDNLPITKQEQALILLTITYRRKTGTKTLTVGEVQQAFENGFIGFTEMDQRFNALGFASQDVLILEQLTLLKMNKLEEAKKVAQFKYDAAVAKAAKAGTPIPPKPPILE